MQKLITVSDVVQDVLSKIEHRYSAHSDRRRHCSRAPRFRFSSLYGAIPTEQLVYIQARGEILRGLALAWISAQLAIRQRIPVIVITNAAQSHAYIELAISALAEVSPKALSTGIFHREFWPAMTRAACSLAESKIFFLTPDSLLDLQKLANHLWKQHDLVAFVASSSLKESTSLQGNLELPDFFKDICDIEDFGAFWVGRRAASLSAHKNPTSLFVSNRKVYGLLHEIIVDGWQTNTVTDGILVGAKPTSERDESQELFT